MDQAYPYNAAAHMGHKNKRLPITTKVTICAEKLGKK